MNVVEDATLTGLRSPDLQIKIAANSRRKNGAS
jgi:hypothetical protein